MNKIVLILVFAVVTSVSTFAQINSSDKPYKAPKGAINLNKVANGVTVKVGQLMYYQWTKTSNMDGFSIGVSGESMQMLKSTGTHIYTDKNKNQVHTYEWKAVEAGDAKIDIMDPSGKESAINVKIQ